MGNNNPENVVARAKLDEDHLGAEARFSPGPGARAFGAIAAFVANRRGPRSEASTEVIFGGEGLNGRFSSRPRKVDLGDAIGKELKVLYDDVVAQAVPDRFLDLLNQLESDAISSEPVSKASGESE